MKRKEIGTKIPLIETRKRKRKREKEREREREREWCRVTEIKRSRECCRCLDNRRGIEAKIVDAFVAFVHLSCYLMVSFGKYI